MAENTTPEQQAPPATREEYEAALRQNLDLDPDFAEQVNSVIGNVSEEVPAPEQEPGLVSRFWNEAQRRRTINPLKIWRQTAQDARDTFRAGGRALLGAAGSALGSAVDLGSHLVKGMAEHNAAQLRAAGQAPPEGFESWYAYQASVTEQIDKDATTSNVVIQDHVRKAKNTLGDNPNMFYDLVEGIAQFGIGMSSVQGVTGSLARGAPKILRAGEMMLKSGAADAAFFDPLEERISNLAIQYPALRNPLTEFLAAEEGDTRAEGRLKNAMEGFVLGGTLDALMGGFRLWRRWRRTKKGEKAVIERLDAEKRQVEQAAEDAVEVPDVLDDVHVEVDVSEMDGAVTVKEVPGRGHAIVPVKPPPPSAVELQDTLTFNPRALEDIPVERVNTLKEIQPQSVTLRPGDSGGINVVVIQDGLDGGPPRIFETPATPENLPTIRAIFRANPEAVVNTPAHSMSVPEDILNVILDRGMKMPEPPARPEIPQAPKEVAAEEGTAAGANPRAKARAEAAAKAREEARKAELEAAEKAHQEALAEWEAKKRKIEEEDAAVEIAEGPPPPPSRRMDVPVFATREQAEAAAANMNLAAKNMAAGTFNDEALSAFREAFEFYQNTGDPRGAAEILDQYGINFRYDLDEEGLQNTVKAIVDVMPYPQHQTRGRVETWEETARAAQDIMAGIPENQAIAYMQSRWASVDQAAAHLTVMRVLMARQTQMLNKLYRALSVDPTNEFAAAQYAKAADALLEMHAYVSGVKSSGGRLLRSMAMPLDEAIKSQRLAAHAEAGDAAIEQWGREALESEADEAAEAVTPRAARERGQAEAAVRVAKAKGPSELPQIVRKNEAFQNPVIREYEMWNKRAERFQKELEQSKDPAADRRMIVEGTGKADPTNQRQKDAQARAIHVEGPKPAGSWAEVAAGHERAAKAAEKAKNAAAAQAHREAARAAKEAQRLLEKAQKEIDRRLAEAIKQYERKGPRKEGPEKARRKGQQVEGPNAPDSVAETGPNHGKRKLTEEQRKERFIQRERERIAREVARQYELLGPRREGPEVPPPAPRERIKAEGPAAEDSVKRRGPSHRAPPGSPKVFEGMTRDEILSLARAVNIATHADNTDGALRILRGRGYDQIAGIADPATREAAKLTLTGYRINAMLSRPRTHWKAAIGNTYATLTHPMAHMIGGILRRNPELSRQGLDIFLGVFMDLGDAWKLARDTGRLGDNILDRNVRSVEHSASLGAWDPTTPWLNRVAQLPSRLLMMQDEFFKSINYRAHVRSQILRQLRKEGVPPEQWADAIEQQMKHHFDGNGGALNPVALQYARVNTFTNSLDYGIGKWLQEGQQKSPLVRFFIPFVRSPTNVFRYAWKQAPVLSMFNREVREAYKAVKNPDLSPAAREAAQERLAIVQGQQAMGFAIWGTTAALFMAGDITGAGPADPTLRKQWMDAGNKPYSLRVPGTNKWISYQGLDPAATTLGLLADFMEGLAEVDNPHDAEKLVAAALGALTSALSSKGYAQSMTEMMDAASSGDANDMQRVIKSLGTSYLPNVSTDLNPDQVLREARTLGEAARAKLPGLSTTLAPRRNILGEPVLRMENWFMRSLSPIVVASKGEPDVLDELLTLGKALPELPNKYRNLVDLRDPKMFPELGGRSARDRMGEILMEPGPGGRNLRQDLERLVASDNWKRAGRGELPMSQHALASQIIRLHHKRAEMQLAKELPDFRAALDQAREVQRVSGMGEDAVRAVNQEYEKLFGRSFIPDPGKIRQSQYTGGDDPGAFELPQ